MSKFKCKVEVNAIPKERLIGKSRLEALVNKFNGSGGKTTQKNFNSLNKMASAKQKESQKIAEQYQAEAKAKREAKKDKGEKSPKSK